MAITYSYDADANMLYSIYEGSITSLDVVNYLAAVSKNENILNFIEIADFSGIEDLTLKFTDAVNFLAKAEVWKKKKHRLSIVYAPTKFSYAIVEFMMLTLQKTDLVIHVSRTRPEMNKLLRRLSLRANR